MILPFGSVPSSTFGASGTPCPGPYFVPDNVVSQYREGRYCLLGIECNTVLQLEFLV